MSNSPSVSGPLRGRRSRNKVSVGEPAEEVVEARDDGGAGGSVIGGFRRLSDWVNFPGRL